ncbi:MAG: hypothetical protein A2Y75_07150 [Candidatus Solincola sediminis]|uniref:FHA domain-containing protein n=1 Tax=Candidatus Solincola sediminis TaxID=1797199 RepID=A0A1F2WJ86_9ACTN|nr:MAG: hypothetical protein A2Y75_07150 [Candidatus Solincola sediminis]
MAGLRKFEKRLEKIFEGPFTKLFKGGVQPLEIARRLLREADDGRMLSVNEVLAPNYYQVNLSPGDYERLAGYFDRLTLEMEGMIIKYTSEKGYHLITRPRVKFERADNLREGEFAVDTTMEKPVGMDIPVAVRPARASGDTIGTLAFLSGENAGSSQDLEGKKTSIGRADDNDLVLQDPRASRFHAEIERTEQGYVLRDLGSTNGTLVGDRRVRERLLEDGDKLTVGETEFRFRLTERPMKRSS